MLMIEVWLILTGGYSDEQLDVYLGIGHWEPVSPRLWNLYFCESKRTGTAVPTESRRRISFDWIFDGLPLSLFSALRDLPYDTVLS